MAAVKKARFLSGSKGIRGSLIFDSTIVKVKQSNLSIEANHVADLLINAFISMKWYYVYLTG